MLATGWKAGSREGAGAAQGPWGSGAPLLLQQGLALYVPEEGWETGKSARMTKASSVQTHLSWVAPRLGSHLPVLPKKLGPGALCSQREKLSGGQGEVHGAGAPPLLKDPQASVPPSSSTLPLPSPPWA